MDQAGLFDSILHYISVMSQFLINNIQLVTCCVTPRSTFESERSHAKS